MTTDVEFDAGLRDIHFWPNLKEPLQEIQRKCGSLEVELSLDVLKHAKCFYVIGHFNSDARLNQALTTVDKYITTIKKYKLEGLHLANDLGKLKLALEKILEQCHKQKSEFREDKALYKSQLFVNEHCSLTKAIHHGFELQLLKILGGKRLFDTQFDDELESAKELLCLIFEDLKDSLRSLISMVRNCDKAYNDTELIMIVDNACTLQRRIHEICQLQKQCYKLQHLVNGISHQAYYDEFKEIAKEIDLAREKLRESNYFDVTKEGMRIWYTLVLEADKNFEKIETRIVSLIAAQLENANSTNEMFRIFSRFNVLWIRPHLRSSMEKYQKQLMRVIKSDFEAFGINFEVSQ